MRHEIICGDALAEMRKMPAASFSAIICDPPYATTNCAWDNPLDWPAIWPELWRLCKAPTSPVVLFSAQPFTTDLICSQRQFFRYEIIWEKTMPTGFLDANRRPLRNHENILVFSQSGYGNYEAQKETGFVAYRSASATSPTHYGNVANSSKERKSDGERHPTSVWKHGKGAIANSLHPTQKPLDLLEKLVKTYSNEGDTILDFTCGSGTTLTAAARCNRSAVGIESSLDYCEISRQRLEVATGTFAPREFGGLFAQTT